MTPDVLQSCLADPMALLNKLKQQHPRLPLSGESFSQSSLEFICKWKGKGMKRIETGLSVEIYSFKSFKSFMSISKDHLSV